MHRALMTPFVANIRLQQSFHWFQSGEQKPTITHYNYLYLNLFTWEWIRANDQTERSEMKWDENKADEIEMNTQQLLSVSSILSLLNSWLILNRCRGTHKCFRSKNVGSKRKGGGAEMSEGKKEALNQMESKLNEIIMIKMELRKVEIRSLESCK